MTSFTPISAAIGGGLIGLAAVLLMLSNGRIAGVSGITGGLLRPRTDDVAWRLAFAAGLILGVFAYQLAAPQPAMPRFDVPWPLIVLGGALVGYGTCLGNGCTSGHGVCGLSRLSPRSAVATLVYLGVAVATVYVVRHIMGVGS